MKLPGFIRPFDPFALLLRGKCLPSRGHHAWACVPGQAKKGARVLSRFPALCFRIPFLIHTHSLATVTGFSGLENGFGGVFVPSITVDSLLPLLSTTHMTHMCVCVRMCGSKMEKLSSGKMEGKMKRAVFMALGNLGECVCPKCVSEPIRIIRILYRPLRPSSREMEENFPIFFGHHFPPLFCRFSLSPASSSVMRLIGLKDAGGRWNFGFR